ncbi:universal stress protein [Winogradskyella bathintestinalis]|uniref:Universal stress protein n=1 Tax=Winogradskyella bathintestinalis TaxID=3035208 RepID=A0ABT7ZWB5_9FLAO|nr:universal stress protein [Winogradskyella bathintestinalis]MDN3493226.1 universal stress protein [Winogradskyella bathintestinalis]
MKKNVLLPTDFSDNAWSAAVYALKLYAEEECDFYFLHASIIKVSMMSNISNKLNRTMLENALNDLNELKDMAEKANANANHNFHIILNECDLDDAIETAIQKHHIDLVVMGTKGATKAKGMFFGSNTVNLIKATKTCPILIVPDEFDFVKPEQIAFPTDFKRFYGEELLPLKRIAELHNSKIRIVHISNENNFEKNQDYNLAMLKVYLEDYPHTFHWMPDYDEKTKEINDFIEELDINILTMINYKHSFIENIIKEPIVKKIGFKPIVPFLVIPCQN